MMAHQRNDATSMRRCQRLVSARVSRELASATRKHNAKPLVSSDRGKGSDGQAPCDRQRGRHGHAQRRRNAETQAASAESRATRGWMIPRSTSAQRSSSHPFPLRPPRSHPSSPIRQLLSLGRVGQCHGLALSGPRRRRRAAACAAGCGWAETAFAGKAAS